MGSTPIRGSITPDEERILRILFVVRGETRILPIQGLETIARLESVGVRRGRFPRHRWQAELSPLDPHFLNSPACSKERLRSSTLRQVECWQQCSCLLWWIEHLMRCLSLHLEPNPLPS